MYNTINRTDTVATLRAEPGLVGGRGELAKTEAE